MGISVMEENYTGDCYICSMEKLDDICEMLLSKGCTIENVVPVEYKFYLFKLVASKLCITFKRPYGMPIDDDPSADVGPGEEGSNQ